ncbi:hypothetical protein GJ631_10145 [Natronomonas sp. CBA1123]|uniref:DUF7533 family protein n=1 Tax=Natronomonas sp. CBA1123 TaxID=2668070 RepID=UPI0012EA321A|nr:hypothetical protein [Natronomonas sp. CBA1123]MUV86915.1 hypothetical protein [Natronomonas sp. CBA1123]
MAFGIVRSLQLIATLVVAGPVALVGVLNVIEGRYVLGAFFLAAAVGLVVVSEYMYLRLADRTVGRVKRLKNIRGGE